MLNSFSDDTTLPLANSLNGAEQQLQQCLVALESQHALSGKMNTESGVMEAASNFSSQGLVNNLLHVLLNLMSIKFRLDHDYRENIKDFNARYLFQDNAEKIYQQVIFTGGEMIISSEKSRITPTFTLIFRDSNALRKLLFSPAPDVLNALLNQEVDFTGNINYLNKFAYMALKAKPTFLS